MIKFFKRKWEEYNKIEDDVVEMIRIKHIAQIMSSSNPQVTGNEIYKCINTATAYGYRLGIEKGVFIGLILGGIFGCLI